MEQQHYCFLYDGSEEQRVAFEVWLQTSELDCYGMKNRYLWSNGSESTYKPPFTILTHTDWLNRIRPLQVGDVVEVLEDENWELWFGDVKKFEGDHYSIVRLNNYSCYLSCGFYFRPHRLRLISRAEKPTEWQPKWGEEVEVSDDRVIWTTALYGCLNPDKSHFTHLTTHGAFNNIRPTPPKPKTLRDEIAELPESLSKETVLAIIERYEKGAQYA